MTPEQIAAHVCREVAELPDRNSPEGWPEAMLVTHDELNAIVRAALSAATPPAAVPMSQKTQDGHSASGDLLGSYGAWRPIETAPKDGTRILVYCFNGEVEVTHWYECWSDRYEEAGEGLYRKVRNKYADGWNGNAPAHWMPLPVAPTGADTGRHGSDEHESGAAMGTPPADNKENGNG